MIAAVPALYWSAVAACLVSGIVGLIVNIARREQGERRRGLWLATSSTLTLLVLALWIARWIAAGHVPLFGSYESAMSLAAAIMAASLAYQLRGAFSSIAGPAAALVAGAVLAHGGLFSDRIYALTISERSWVVDVHAFFSWAAFGVLTANAALSLRALLVHEQATGARGRLVARTLEVGFVLHTGMMLSGSLYKFLLFGKLWSFDPMETMGLVAWLAYGTLLHMLRFAGWRERRLAGWCLFLFVLLVVSYRVIVYFPAWSSYHILDIDLRMHLME